MSSLSLIASLLLAFPAAAADIVDTAETTVEATPDAQQQDEQPVQTSAALETEQRSLFDEEKPNEIIAGPLTFSGAAIEAFKTESILQLINPVAPQEEYGYAEDNVVRDPIDNKVSGLKLFSIKF